MSSDPRDYKLDISSLSGAGPMSDRGPQDAARPFLSVLFGCCHVYQRVYRDPVANAYRGRCPKCGRAVHFPIGQSGTAARFFRAE
jgi:hypothetical protein